MIQLCLSLAAAMAVNTPLEVEARSAELRARIATKECMLAPAAELQAAVQAMRIVHEFQDVYVIEGVAGGFRFWSWTNKDSEFGKRLAQQGNA